MKNTRILFGHVLNVHPDLTFDIDLACKESRFVRMIIKKKPIDNGTPNDIKKGDYLKIISTNFYDIKLQKDIRRTMVGYANPTEASHLFRIQSDELKEYLKNEKNGNPAND
jgi:hypothetical protein